MGRRRTGRTRLAVGTGTPWRCCGGGGCCWEPLSLSPRWCEAADTMAAEDDAMPDGENAAVTGDSSCNGISGATFEILTQTNEREQAVQAARDCAMLRMRKRTSLDR